jgi:hypothetical protein
MTAVPNFFAEFPSFRGIERTTTAEVARDFTGGLRRSR